MFSAQQLLKQRQKMVLLADSTELGWRVVSEYESNPIASDSEDEKKIFRAEARALRRVKAERSKKSRRGWPYKRPEAASTATVTSGQQGARQRPGLCFNCGKPGHWKNECTQTSSQQNNKISTYVSLSQSNNEDLSCNKQVVCRESNTEKMSVVSVENTGTDEPVSPFGRLKSHYENWANVSDDTYILDTVKNGYKIPFKVLPEVACIGNNKSARDNPEFVVSEINSLLRKRVISEVNKKPHIVNPLTVAYSRTGKPRLVLDCRHINPCLHLFKVKFEDIKVAECLFDVNSYIFTFDLKSAYHHIDIFSEHTTYLGFSWLCDGITKYYVYNSLPFGISTAGHIFTKMLKIPLKYWRSLGFKVIMFLDDGIGGDVLLEKAKFASTFIRESLLEFGFLLAEDKCSWQPVRKGAWLGHTLDFVANKLYISEERICRLEMSVRSLLFQISSDKLNLVQVRALAGVVGQIISLQSVLGKIVSRMSRYLYKCIVSRVSWNALVKVSPEAVAELQFWQKSARSLNNGGKVLRQNVVATFCMYTDASAVGYGGFLAKNNGGIRQEGSKSVSTDLLVSNLDLGKQEWSGYDPETLSCTSIESWPPEVGMSGVDKSICLDRDSVNQIPGSESEVVLSPEVDMDLYECSNSKEPSCLISTKVDICIEQIPDSKCSHPVCPEEHGCNNNIVDGSQVQGSWTELEASQSSTWRELEAVHRVLKSCTKIVQHKVVALYTDNKNVSYILASGSNVRSLHDICLAIHDWCIKYEVSLSATWIPRKQNVHADYLSRCHDCDDWSIRQSIFEYLNQKWGPYTVDRFATHYNAKCLRFNSRYWVPGTEAVDSFTQCWRGERNWVVPPPSCIMKSIKKMKYDRCCGTIVVPKWESAPFWSMIINRKGEYCDFVKDVFELPLTGVVTPGRGNNGMFTNEPLSFRLLALRCDCRDADYI